MKHSNTDLGVAPREIFTEEKNHPENFEKVSREKSVSSGLHRKSDDGDYWDKHYTKLEQQFIN